MNNTNKKINTNIENINENNRNDLSEDFVVAADCSHAQETSLQGRRRLASVDSRNLLPKKQAKGEVDWLQQSEENSRPKNLRVNKKIKNNDERNHKDRYKNNKRTGDNMKKIEEIIMTYRPLILASITRYCNLPGYFDDLYQDGVVEIIEAMKEYDPAKGTVGGYLKTRLKLFYINKYKRLIRRETDDIDNIKGKDQPSVMAIADHENKMLVARLLSTLNPDERTVIELTFLMDMRAAEVSRIMGISKRRVYHLKEKAMNKLKKTSTRENLSMMDIMNEEDVYKGGGKKTYNNME
ncbi:sigma-70 family RNA polymerase sigma factor [uncultured Ezakiella sp.]|uniref:sigma-70 family RNA polymerase sigma factor n=1 Tax=uncultured Ezakiella sp. TaxID=1637529 RepID=UPI0025F583C9|nr:sigma-70 family RNA polymerase sigma factor [uncultured Ezakiella sp.]